MNKRRFILTEEHLKLLRAAYVGWQDCEFGAPEIDPKRPYGDSSVCHDIHEILTGERIGRVGDKRDTLTEEEKERYTSLHRETGTALQIVLATGRFESGEYELEGYGINWHKVD